MSELAAFVFWVVAEDSRKAWGDPATQTVLHPNHLELNTYLLFDALMRAKMREFYKFEDKATTRRKEIPINRKSAAIFKRLLRPLDEEFHKHLEAHKFQPIISCLKWVRLMYLREFEVDSCLLLWDFLLKNFGLKVEIFDFRNNKVLREENGAIQHFDIFDFVCVALYFLHRPAIMKTDSEIGIVQALQETVKVPVQEVMALAEELTRKYAAEVDKAKQREQERLHTLLNGFTVVSGNKGPAVPKETPRVEPVDPGTSKSAAEAELGTSSISKAKETVKGTIFDDKIGFKSHPKRPNFRQDLGGIIEDLEAENAVLQNDRIVAILGRLKEMKRHL